MKNRNANTSIKTLHIFGDNRYLWQSLTPAEFDRPPDFNKPSAPPFTTDKYFISQDIHGIRQCLVLTSARYPARWHPTRAIFVVLFSVVVLNFSPMLLLAPWCYILGIRTIVFFGLAVATIYELPSYDLRSIALYRRRLQLLTKVFRK